VHVEPIGLSVQEVPLQMLGATQSVIDVAAVQVVRHAPAVMSQVYFPHGNVVAARQTPAPSQVRCDSAVTVSIQVDAAHCVPAMYLRQPPAPSQVPSVPQVDAADIVHWDATSGAVPAGIGEQVPTLPVIPHDMHVPVQAVLQQILFTQWPCAQSVSSPDGQLPPFGILPQLELTQVLPIVQSAAVVVQVILHAVAPHWYGSQGLVVAARHVPAPSQVRAE